MSGFQFLRISFLWFVGIGTRKLKEKFLYLWFHRKITGKKNPLVPHGKYPIHKEKG
jgi:hypothetical protein